MKKVLIIPGALKLGGAERVAALVGLRADKRAYAVDYLVFGGDVGEYEAEVEKAGCRVFRMPPPAAGHRAFLRSLRALLRRERYDVVHCHTMFNAGLVLWQAKRAGVPRRIAHSHTVKSPYRRPLKKRLYESVMRLLIRRCATDHAACGTAAGQWLYGSRFFEKHGVLIPNGIDCAAFAYDEGNRRALRASLGLGERLTLGHAGHMADVKNQRFLLRLLKLLRDGGTDAALLLLGDGPDRPALAALAAELGIAPYVAMTGNVRNVGDYLSAMDVFVFPSRYEGTPLALLEAQANGLPCVVSDRVPADALVTPLVRALSLDEPPKRWAEAVTAARRGDCDEATELLAARGFSENGCCRRIFALYGAGGSL